MAAITFEGDLNGISDTQLDFIKGVLTERGIQTNVLIEAVGKAGDNYVANVKRLSIQDNNSKKIFIIAKIAPDNEIVRMTTNTNIVFKNESLMYLKVLPKLVELQRQANVPENQLFRYAKCYGAFNEAPNEVILLEDLRESGFAMLDRFKPLPNECVRSVLKDMAVLHSLSYVLKHKEPETYDQYKCELRDLWEAMAAVPEMTNYFKQLESSAVALLDKEEHKNIARGVVGEVVSLSYNLNKGDRDSKFAVIQQGDAWTNNLMFKFKDDVLVENIMIDYQLSKSASPVVDFLYMTFNGSDYQHRKEHLLEWMDLYHSELDKSLSIYGLKASSVYPREQFDADLKRYGKMMFGQACILSNVLLMKPEDAGKMKDLMGDAEGLEKLETLSINSLDTETIALFKTRIAELADSFREFGFV